ncbi:MAG: TolC family outer membrane protein [Alphaproteobacteria bacterium]|nr:TolC family outer membrane protein [Alphaproteobacteria bacterium]
MKNFKCAISVIAFLGLAAQSAVVCAEELQMNVTDALVASYQTNPGLEAARAALRAVDENYAIAYAGFRPVVTGRGSYTSTRSEGSGTLATSSDPKEVSLTATQSLYQGGSTVADVTEAAKTIKAARANLWRTEQAVLLDAVTVYMDVLRDQRIVDLNISNERVLESHLEASRERFRLGDITKTDVSQAESRLASAVAGRIRAAADLKISRARFEEVTGLVPTGQLPLPPTAALELPETLEAALEAASANNPRVIEAHHNGEAAAAGTRSIKGELLPSVDLSGSVVRTYDNNGVAGNKYVDQTSVALQATVPLYGGGDTYSRIRRARQIEAQRRREVDTALRVVVQDTTDAWETLDAARAALKAQTKQVEAARLAEEGVRVEAQYGSRTTLDLLDAEQEYLTAQVARVISERDIVVASYELLSTVGKLTADDLHLPVDIYDPTKNFQKVSGKWFGTRIDGGE